MNTAIKPRAYDLADAGEVDRLLREVAGYLETCRRQHHGTDFQGRMFAADAMREFPATIAQLRAEVERLREDRDSHQRIAITAMTRADKAEAALAKAIDGSCVEDTIRECGGWWRPCSGCYESNEGYPVGPYSRVLGCDQGGGCSECGGLGAVWNYYTEEELADLHRASLTEGE